MHDTYYSDNELATRYGVTMQTIWRWRREQATFPRAVALYSGCTRWKLSEIEAWGQARSVA